MVSPLQPERIEPQDPQNHSYDVRADVWSLGLTLVEMSKGCFPYPPCTCDFQLMTLILSKPSPQPDPECFNEEFCDFCKIWYVSSFSSLLRYWCHLFCLWSSCSLEKNVKNRPKYNRLLVSILHDQVVHSWANHPHVFILFLLSLFLQQHSFILMYKEKDVKVGEWYQKTIANLPDWWINVNFNPTNKQIISRQGTMWLSSWLFLCQADRSFIRRFTLFRLLTRGILNLSSCWIVRLLLIHWATNLSELWNRFPMICADRWILAAGFTDALSPKEVTHISVHCTHCIWWRWRRQEKRNKVKEKKYLPPCYHILESVKSDAPINCPLIVQTCHGGVVYQCGWKESQWAKKTEAATLATRW